jgi:DNA-binding PadR family transcriptional regulator
MKMDTDNEKNDVIISNETYNKLHDPNSFTKIDNRILASSEFTTNEKIWLMFIRSKRSYFIQNKMIDPNGWFYYLQKYITIHTQITERTQSRIIQQLTKKGILEVKTISDDPRNYYRINNQKYEEFAERSNKMLDEQNQQVTNSVPKKITTAPDKMSTEQNQQVTNLVSDKMSATQQTKCLHINKIKLNKIKSVINTSYLAGSPNLHINKEIIDKEVKLRNEDNPVKTSNLHPKKKININRSVELKIEDDLVPVKPRFAKRRKIPIPVKTDEVLEIFDYWKNKGFPVHKENSGGYIKSVNDIKAVLDGSLFSSFKDRGVIRKYSVNEVKISINNFALSAFGRDYMPVNQSVKVFFQNMKLCDFFYNPRKGSDKDKSLFLKNLFSKPTLVSNSKMFLANDIYPRTTSILVNWYKNKFGNKLNGIIPTADRNKMVFCGKALKQFYEENKTKLQISSEWKRIYGEYDEVNFLAVQLTRALDKELRENEALYSVFHLGWLTSEKTLQERLPNFLRSESIMKK